MEHKHPPQTFNYTSVQPADSLEANSSSYILGKAEEKESVIIIANPPQHLPIHEHSLPNPLEYEHLANSANSEMIRVSNPSSAKPVRVISHLQPATHEQEYFQQPTSQQQTLRSAKSHTQVVQPSFGTPQNVGSGGSSVRGWTGQLQQISRNIKDGRPLILLTQEGGHVHSRSQVTPHRPASQSPHSHQPNIHFNYNFTNPSISRPQVAPQPAIISPPAYQVTHQTKIINPQPDLQQQIVYWQQHYFTVIERFQFVYSRFQSITRQVIVIREKMDRCRDPAQLQQLKQRLNALQSQISQTEQQMVEIVNKNKEVIGDTVNWQAKYQELLEKYNKIAYQRPQQARDVQPPSSQLASKLEILETQLIEVRNNYNKAMQNSQQATKKVTLYEEQIGRLNYILQKFDSDSAHYLQQISALQEILHEKDDEIEMLRMLVQQQKSAISNEQQTTNLSKTILTLKHEKEELSRHLKRNVEELDAYKRATEERIGRYESEARRRGDEIQHYQGLVEEKLKIIETLKQSNPATQAKLPIVPNINYEQDLRVLRQKLQSAHAEARSYQQKITYIQNVTDDILNEKNELYNKVTNLQLQLSKRNETLADLQDRILYLEDQINASQGSSKQIEGDYKQLNEHLENLRQEYNLKVIEIEEYTKKYNESQRFLATTSQELNHLKNKYEELNLKRSTEILQENPEITVLRQRVKTLEKQLVSERSQNDALRAEVDRLETDKRKITRTQSSQFNEQYLLMEESIGKKDQEIARLRQTNQLLQTNIDQLSIEFQKIRAKAANDFKSSENQKAQLNHHLFGLQFKISQYERKVVSLEDIKGIMQQQVNTLTTELNAKIDNLQRVEIQLKQEKAKVRSFESDLQTHLNDSEDIKLKLKESEKKSQSLIKTLQADLEKKKEEITLKISELAHLSNKIIDLQNAIKSKDAHISQLQRNNQSYKLKVMNFDNYLEEIKYLKQKITEYESKVSSLAFRPLTRKPNTEPTQIFERKIIYQLKLQNQALRQQLGLSMKPNGNPKEGEQEVRERLTDFNHKLEEVIGQTWNGEVLNDQTQLFKKYERDRRKLIQRHNEQIAQLKVRLLQMQKSSTNNYNAQPLKQYSAISVYNQQILFYKQKNQQLQEMVENHIKVNRELKESIERLMKGHQEEYSIIYYKDQLARANELNQNLQEKLKRLQNELRKAKEELARYSQKPNVTHAELEIRIVQLNRRISQLVLEINQLEQDKIEAQEQTQTSQRQLQKLRSDNDELNITKQDAIRQMKERERQLQEEVAKLSNKVKIQQSEIERLSEEFNKRHNAQSGQVKALKTKIVEFQQQSRKLRLRIEELVSLEDRYKRESAKYENQILLLGNQIQKLKENGDVALRKHKEYDVQLANLKAVIADYQTKMRSKDSTVNEYNYRETQLQQQITRLKSQVALLSQQIERVNQFSQKKLAQKQAELLRLKSLVGQRQQQISSLEVQLNQSKVYMIRATQSSQQVINLQEQISRLRNALSLKSSQYERKVQEILDYQGRLTFTEDQIKELRKSADVKAAEFSNIISRLEAQLRDQQRLRENSQAQLNSTIAKFQGQLRDIQRIKQQQVSELKIRIYVLQSQIKDFEKSTSDAGRLHEMIITLEGQLQQLKRRKDLQVSQLKTTISNLEDQLRELNQREQASSDLAAKVRYLEQQLLEVTRAKDTEISELNIAISNMKNQLRDADYYKLEYSQLTQAYRQLEANFKQIDQSYTRLESELQQLIIVKAQEKEYLEGIIVTLQAQIRDLQSGKNSSEGDIALLRQQILRLESLIATYQKVINSKQDEIKELNLKLHTLTLQLSRYESEISQYQISISQIQNNLAGLHQAFDAFRHRCVYTVELMRSILISIETLVKEEEKLEFAVAQTINKEIACGLEECDNWNRT